MIYYHIPVGLSCSTVADVTIDFVTSSVSLRVQAARCFIKAGLGASNETLLLSRVLQIEDKGHFSNDEIEVLYYTKVSR